MAATLLFAPYRFEGRGWAANAEGRLVEPPMSGTIYHPVFASLHTDGSSESRQWWYLRQRVMTLHEVRLDGSKLLVWWAGIALLTAAGVALAAPRGASSAVEARPS